MPIRAAATATTAAAGLSLGMAVGSAAVVMTAAGFTGIYVSVRSGPCMCLTVMVLSTRSASSQAVVALLLRGSNGPLSLGHYVGAGVFPACILTILQGNLPVRFCDSVGNCLLAASAVAPVVESSLIQLPLRTASCAARPVATLFLQPVATATTRISSVGEHSLHACPCQG